MCHGGVGWGGVGCIMKGWGGCVMKGWGGCVMEEEPVMEGWGLSWRGGVGHIQGWCGVCHEEVGWVVMQGWGVWCVMKGWGGVCHVGVGWGVS